MRYLITGGSGYIGSRLVDRLSGRDGTDRIVVCDVRPPRSFRPEVHFEQLDVRDAVRAREVVERERPDALVHLAFILNPIHDERAMYDVDVNGTSNVLAAAAAADVGHVLVTSSATAYGAFPDNPVPLTEENPVRGVPDFEYARDKAESDRLCQLWALQHPDRTVTIVRPCIVFGPSVDNYISRLWTKQPFQADLGGPDVPVQFVHEDDVVEALIRLLDGGHGGAFNLAGTGTMTVRECADAIGLPRKRVPLALYRRFAAALWRLRLSETPPGNLRFALYPWVVSTDRLEATLDWKPRYSSRETFEITMRSRGALGGGDGVERPEAPTPVAAA